MLRDMVGKVVRRTPGLRRVRGLVRGAGDSNGAPAPTPTRYGAESPKAESPKAQSQKAQSQKAQSQKAESPKAKSPAEIEALRAEAEKKKAEIRARKEAEAAAAPAAAASPAAAAPTGIAAMIAQTGGNVEEMGANAGVRATSGIDWVPENTDVHLAEDGVEFWGAIDNDSSRSFAKGDTLVIDQWECINCGTCVENTEHVFLLPDDAKAVVLSQEGPMDLIQDAIDACPVTCIHWTDDPSQYEQINDAEGAPLD